MQRNKAVTKRKIFDAMVEILTDKGFEAVGVNAIARKAGVSKSLIYRYFGSLEGLMLAYAQEGDFWPMLEVAARRDLKAQSAIELGEAAKSVMLHALRELRSRRSTQEILRWELFETSELSHTLSGYRNRQASLFLRPFREASMGKLVDVNAIAAVIGTSFFYLILRSKTAKHIYDLDIQTEEGWKRVADALSFIYDAVFEKIDRLQQQDSPVPGDTNPATA
jgi:AcrR family transcriptional regulator